jgi:hypothetical protein
MDQQFRELPRLHTGQTEVGTIRSQGVGKYGSDVNMETDSRSSNAIILLPQEQSRQPAIQILRT